MTECIQIFKFPLYLQYLLIDFRSPNFCHWCILGHRWPDYVFGSKGQRSHHRGRGSQHSTTRRYHRVQLFLVLQDELWMRQREKPSPNCQSRFFENRTAETEFLVLNFEVVLVFRIVPIPDIFIGFRTPLDRTRCHLVGTDTDCCI